jgi:hypothetical protein
MKMLLLSLALLMAPVSHAQTVWTTTNASGAVTGFYANAAPSPTPQNCCTQMDMSDARMTAYQNSTTTPAQTYAAAINGGLTVTSTSTASLNGTYAVDLQAQSNFAAIATSIAANQGLPNGASTITWYDISGAGHAFTAAQLLTLADAVRNYVYTLDYTQKTLQSGGSATWPTASATIP